jgi:histidinol-phosphate aminotransferase
MPPSFIQDLLPPWAKRLRPYLHGKPIEEIERELGRSTVRLASNENPLGPSPRALEAIRQSLDSVNRFLESSGFFLRQKLAALHGLDMNQFVLGAGATDLI